MGARSRQGCLPCRRRKKKCDEIKPICTACERNCLGCDWPALPLQQEPMKPRQFSGTDELRFQSTSMSKSPIGLAQIPIALSPLALSRPMPFGPQSQRLLYHYIEDTANRLVCLQENDNPFLHIVVPAALDDDLLMHAILALSGVHLMQRLPCPNYAVQCSTWFSYTRALKILRVGLSDGFKDDSSVDAALRALLIVLIFYMIEAILGSGRDAMKRHLEGSNYLMQYILRTNPSCLQSSIGSFIAELYVYHACLGSFTVQCPDLEILHSNARTSSPQYNTVGILSGCAQELFEFIPSVASLIRKSTERNTFAHQHEGNLFREYCDLRSPIAVWKPNRAKSDLVYGAELYQQSLLILLDTHFAIESEQGSIQRAFEHLKSLLSHLPPTSPVATTATWPLFIFGVIAHEQSQKDMIREYMQSLIRVFGIGIMGTTLAYLERGWAMNCDLNIPDRFSSQDGMLIC